MRPRTLVSLLCLVACSLLAKAEDAARRSCGFIARMEGRVSIGEEGQIEHVLLDPQADSHRRIYPGQRLRCEKGSKALLRLRDGDQWLLPAMGWFTVPQPRVTATRDARQKALDAYAQVGGRDRAVRMPRLYSPPDHGVVIPRQFTIRWAPGGSCSHSFTIFDADGVVLWRQAEVRNAGGALASPAARTALVHHRIVASADPAPLTLEMLDSCGNAAAVTFRLLSAESERAVNDQLQRWASEPDAFFRHLGNASVFDDAGLYPEAAGEYEGALSLAPRGRDILLRTIAAERLTGNGARADQLELRLRPE
jgi:hypothetical protein